MIDELDRHKLRDSDKQFYGSTLLFGNRVALNPSLGGVRDVASVIISHEQT